MMMRDPVVGLNDRALGAAFPTCFSSVLDVKFASFAQIREMLVLYLLSDDSDVNKKAE